MQGLRPFVASLAAAGTLLFASWLLAQVGQPFEPGCSLPYSGERQVIDDDCGIEGKDTSVAKRLESRAKNDLCATGTPTWVTFYTFKKLKQATDAADFDLGADRSGARNVRRTNPSGDVIGEGSLVKLAAFVIRADTANKSSGENVNCKKGGRPRNDIHIHLAPTRSMEVENFCAAVVAEMIPHFRPDSFNAGDLALTQTHGRPIRVTGHLLYDGNHPVRCDQNTPANSRASTWEIHPVYSVDVCKFKTLTTCDARNDSRWEPLADWIAAQEDTEDDH